MTRYVALLRGINVGGKNVIRMHDLRSAFEDLGFADVATYIQSGNVLFTTAGTKPHPLVNRIEKALGATFNYRASIVLRSQKQMRNIVAQAPDGFGSDPAQFRYDVLFLKEPLTAARALGVVPARDGVDRVYPGSGVLYYTRLTSKAAQSQLNRLVAMPIYKSMTVRNWNTTTAILALFNEA